MIGHLPLLLSLSLSISHYLCCAVSVGRHDEWTEEENETTVCLVPIDVVVVDGGHPSVRIPSSSSPPLYEQAPREGTEEAKWIHAEIKRERSLNKQKKNFSLSCSRPSAGRFFFGSFQMCAIYHLLHHLSTKKKKTAKQLELSFLSFSFKIFFPFLLFSIFTYFIPSA